MRKTLSTVVLTRQEAESVATSLYAVVERKYKGRGGAPPKDPLMWVAEVLRDGWAIIVQESDA